LITYLPPSRRWYQALVGRPEDNHPTETLVEWQITEAGWIQVFDDPDRAESTLLNFAVDDLDAQAAALAARGLELDEIQTANKGVRTACITDPDGNRITIVGVSELFTEHRGGPGATIAGAVRQFGTTGAQRGHDSLTQSGSLPALPDGYD
jgi:glyoxylase I family protein